MLDASCVQEGGEHRDFAFEQPELQKLFRHAIEGLGLEEIYEPGSLLLTGLLLHELRAQLALSSHLIKRSAEGFTRFCLQIGDDFLKQCRADGLGDKIGFHDVWAESGRPATMRGPWAQSFSSTRPLASGPMP